MKIHIKKLSKKIRNLREDRSLTQEELAHSLGVSRQSIIALESGRCLPSLPLALSFVELFDLPFERIFLDNKEREEVKTIMAHDLMPWSPFREVNDLHSAIDRLFEENAPNAKNLTLPPVNVYEQGKEVVITIDLPGVKEDDITIEVGSDSVTIAGERRIETETKEENFYRKETSFGCFSRTIPLPSTVNKDNAEAELKDGTLTIKIAKKAKIKPKVTKLKVKKG